MYYKNELSELLSNIDNKSYTTYINTMLSLIDKLENREIIDTRLEQNFLELLESFKKYIAGDKSYNVDIVRTYTYINEYVKKQYSMKQYDNVSSVFNLAFFLIGAPLGAVLAAKFGKVYMAVGMIIGAIAAMIISDTYRKSAEREYTLY